MLERKTMTRGEDPKPQLEGERGVVPPLIASSSFASDLSFCIFIYGQLVFSTMHKSHRRNGGSLVER